MYVRKPEPDRQRAILEAITRSNPDLAGEIMTAGHAKAAKLLRQWETNPSYGPPRPVGGA